jgi:glutaredoxin
MPRVVVYTHAGCHLCEVALAELRSLQGELAFALVERDIREEERLVRAYFERVPVIELDGEHVCDLRLDEALLRERLARRASAQGARS